MTRQRADFCPFLLEFQQSPLIVPFWDIHLPHFLAVSLPTVPTKTVLTWCGDKLGKTVQATRRVLFAPLRKAEQKPDQILLAA
jgi:hypothetical protein